MRIRPVADLGNVQKERLKLLPEKNCRPDTIHLLLKEKKYDTTEYNKPVNSMLPADFFLFMANTAQYLQAKRYGQ